MTEIAKKEPIPLMGFKVLVMGGVGTGKTYCIRTLIEAGITQMVILTEPSDVLGDIPAEKLHWKYISPVTADLSVLESQIKNVAMMDQAGLCKTVDMNRHKDNKLIEYMKTLNNFVCDRTGESFGPVSKWGNDKCLVVDSLSGLTLMAWGATVGNRMGKNIADYGTAQQLLENQINLLCTAISCPVVMTAHLDRQTDEVEGGSKIMAALPGKQLSQKVGMFFSDVVLAKRVGKDYKWSVLESNMDLKGRNLALSNDLQASFVQIVESWKKKGGVVG
jgi:hypothetical protein